MSVRILAVQLAMALSACASHEGPNSTIYTPDSPLDDLKIAVASVQLIQDCKDPEPVAAGPVARQQVEEPEAGSVEQPAAARMKRPAGDGSSFEQPCTQSTMQLSLTNNGGAPAKLQIQSVRLLDAATRRELGTLVARKPSLWDAAVYQPWDENIVGGGVAMSVAYRLADPDWSQVQAALEPGTNLFARPFVLEVEVSVHGVTQKVLSPEFVRQGVFMVVT